METVGIVSPGAMGSALGAVLARGGARVVATAAARSARTRRLAAASGTELLPGLDDVVGAADLVLSVVPPAEAQAVATEIVRAAERTGNTPLVADLNAIAPATARSLAATLAGARLDLVDGSISGPPPVRPGTTTVYLSGPRAAEIGDLAAPGLEIRLVGADVGLASAVKMCTAAVYKGQLAVLVQALRAADALGVLPFVLADLGALAETAHVSVARAVTKAGRYTGEMGEIAETQRSIGLTPVLYEAMAEVYRLLGETGLAAVAPEAIDGSLELEEVLARLRTAES